MDGWKNKLKMRLPAVALLAATCLFWSLYDRYQPAGPVLLQAPTLADAARAATLAHFRTMALTADTKETDRFDPVTVADRLFDSR